MESITKSWRTTIGGILLGVGVPLSSVGEGIYRTIGVVLAALGGVLMGVTAQDHGKK